MPPGPPIFSPLHPLKMPPLRASSPFRSLDQAPIEYPRFWALASTRPRLSVIPVEFVTRLWSAIQLVVYFGKRVLGALPFMLTANPGLLRSDARIRVLFFPARSSTPVSHLSSPLQRLPMQSTVLSMFILLKMGNVSCSYLAFKSVTDRWQIMYPVEHRST